MELGEPGWLEFAVCSAVLLSAVRQRVKSKEPLFNFRKVRLEDQDELRRMTKGLFGGNDYVADVTPAWVEKGYFFGLADEQDKIVACANLYVSDDKDYAYFGGLRVSPFTQSKGLGTKVVCGVCDSHPEIRVISYSTFKWNYASIAVAKKAGFSHRRMYLFSSFSEPHVEGEPYVSFTRDSVMDWRCKLEQVSCGGQMVAITKPQEILDKIYGAVNDLAYLISAWDLFLPTANSVQKIIDQKQSEAYYLPSHPSVVTMANVEERKSLGLTMFLSVYASSGEDLEVLARHMIHWIDIFRERKCTTLCFFFVAPVGQPYWQEDYFGRVREFVVLDKIKDSEQSSK